MSKQNCQRYDEVFNVTRIKLISMDKVFSVLCQLTSISILKLSIDNFQNQFEIPTYSKLTKTLTQVLCNCQQLKTENRKVFWGKSTKALLKILERLNGGSPVVK